ncbi:conjugative transposon protein TraM [Agriterribacter sp.]|uniref:conjugative transposon protein TraM n=1 Tax=Agriterribacter sp. TaxID=2821509 RepID=UPI002BCF268E|nr:conjugative transposon protein TraM [Agriterribacter sp.]HTN05142.1 conjugative transposon protein TraM [Agriterribacter sp.]
MKDIQQPQAFLRKRKMLLALPLLIIPFITMAFWALGGGKGSDAQAAMNTRQDGLNLNLPGANNREDNSLDKLGYYEKAATDSARLRELIKNDPYFNKQIEQEKEDTIAEETIEEVILPGNKSYLSGELNASPYGRKAYSDPNEEKVYQKLDQLNRSLNEATTGNEQEEIYLPEHQQAGLPTENVDRLEQMMQMMTQNATTEDPEMNRLSGMLDKILDIQHPERMRDRLKDQSEKSRDQVFVVTSDAPKSNISLLDTSRIIAPTKATGFFGLNDEMAVVVSQNAIEAVVHENQTLVNGAVIKMRLLNDIYINGHLIGKDNFVFGTASLNNERLNVEINSIRDQNSLYPVKLEVFDMDGLPGIYIPGAITRDVAKQSTDNALQSVALNNLNPSIGSQAASAGIETAKTLLSKKVKLVKVQVKAGYKILLKDKNTQQ